MEDKITGKELLEASSKLIKVIIVASMFGVPIEPNEAFVYYGAYVLSRKYFF